MAIKVSIRTQILFAIWGVVTSVSLLFSYLLYQTQKNEYLSGIDQKLVAGAELARAFVGENYHDAITDRSSVTTEDYLAIVDAYNKACSKTGFQYLWSNLFLEDGSIVFTTGTSTSKNVEKGDHALFFDTHSDPAAFEPVIQAGKTTFSSFENEWGGGRMVLIPHKDAKGRTYVFGASISTVEFDARIQKTGERAALVFVVMFVIGSVVSILVAQVIAGPVRRLNQTAKEIAEGKYGNKVEKISGGAELVELTETVNAMSDEILANYEELGKTVRQLEEAQDELSRSHNELEVRVAERTRDVRKLTKAIEQSPYMVMITALDGTIEYVNRRFTELTGYSPEEAIGQNPKILQSGDMPQDFYERLYDALASTGEWSGEIKDMRKDGRVFWASVTIAAVTDKKGRAENYISIHDDITERKMAERSIKNAKDQAEAASRAKSEMLANMSHEFRTPLNAILGFSDTIKAEAFGPVENDKYREYIEDIHRSGSHLLELINDVLDVSAIEAGKMELREEVAEINQIIDPCIRLVAPRAEASFIKLTTEIPDDLPNLKVDVRRMKQALLNLLSNAVKFTPERGNVSVIVDWQPEEFLKIAIEDNGIGMSEEELAKALQQFGQVDSSLSRKFDGTGLGLTLTKGLAELHGGEILIESEKGKGTIVTLVLPGSRLIEA